MAELVWVFAAVTGRLECRPEIEWKWPVISPYWVLGGLLVVLAVTGFWPPYRPWNFCLLAVALWTAFALLEAQIKEMKVWVVLGGVYLALRAFNSPSASGAVWFLELTGLLVIFYFMAAKLPQFQKFWMVFAGLGLLWAVKLGWYCWDSAPPFGLEWIQFQTRDVAGWVFYPNPKHLAVFLIPLIFILFRKPVSFNPFKVLLLSLSLIVIVRLKALGALAGLAAGWLWNFRKRPLRLLMVALLITAGLIALRFFNSSATKYGRLDIWPSALNVWAESPLVGVGPGVFAGEYHRVQVPRISGVNRYLMDAVYAHNEFLDLLAAFGVVGFIFVLVLAYRFFSGIKREENKNAMIGLGAASLFDFCLRSPLTALLGVGCVVKEETPARDLSCAGGLLVLGLAAGLFGAPVFSPVLRDQADAYAMTGHYAEAFRCGKQAVELNPWDDRIVLWQSDFYEGLYGMTKDEAWRTKADESLDKAIDLEKADGDLVFKKTKRLTDRYEANPSGESFTAASQGWMEAEKALPLNAYVFFEEGLFWMKTGQLSHIPLWSTGGYGTRVWSCFTRATQLEPNFAGAWVNLGFCEAQRPSSISPSNGKKLYFNQALQVYDQWKNAPGLSPEEKQLVDLPLPEVARLRKEVAP
jgi:O-antigen ligase